MSTAPGFRTLFATACSVVCLLQSAICNPQSAMADEVHWRTDYSAARHEADEKGRPLLLNFSADNCTWCRKLDTTTFRDPTVVAVVNDRFVPLKLDSHRDKQLAKVLDIRNFPTLVVAAADGKVLGTYVGYQDVTHFHEILLRVLGSQSNPEWMWEDYREAARAAAGSEFARALLRLRGILEDGQQRPAQVRAKQLLTEIEAQAAARLTAAKQLAGKGQMPEAVTALLELQRAFPGTPAAIEAGPVLAGLSARPEGRALVRSRRAQALLAQAREEYAAENYLGCLERCEALAADFRDLPEGAEARQLALEVKSHPERLRGACDGLGERLGRLYLDLAETWVQRGQVDQAMGCLERVLQLLPGSRYADTARVRLTRLRSVQMETSLKVSP
jgi:thioredoxin-like negative regulator of GroEL